MKKYIIFLVIIVGIIIVFSNLSTILPIMDNDEYFIDENNIIHGSDCPYKNVPWFTTKHSKYNLLLRKDQEICRDCLLFEEEKLWELHYINIDLRIKELRANGATENYIEKKMQEYQ